MTSPRPASTFSTRSRSPPRAWHLISSKRSTATGSCSGAARWDAQHTLAFGTAEQVREEAARNARIFGAGGGFVFQQRAQRPGHGSHGKHVGAPAAMRYGHFDDARREYVVTRPDTPLPWINYLGVDEYCGLISNTAGGYSFFRDPRERRILRYRYNNVPTDRPGRYIYLRDNATGDYWSGSWQPVLKDLEGYRYECRHGLSYTAISAAFRGSERRQPTSCRLGEKPRDLAPEGDQLLEEEAEHRDLHVWPSSACGTRCDMTDFQYNLNIGQTKFSSNTIYHVTTTMPTQPSYAWFWANRKVASWDGFARPSSGRTGPNRTRIAVEKGRCSRTAAVGWAPCAAMQVELALGPGAEEEIGLRSRYGRDVGWEDAPSRKENTVLRRVRPRAPEAPCLLGRFTREVHGRDPRCAVNTMVNIWNQYQCRTTFNWSRSASNSRIGHRKRHGSVIPTRTSRLRPPDPGAGNGSGSWTSPPRSSPRAGHTTS